MELNLTGRHYIGDMDWSLQELELLFQVAGDLKEKFRRGIPHAMLRDKTLFMIFFEQSTRTRNSFEAGMTQLGGHAHDLTPDKMQISHGESPKDTGMVLSRYGHGIAIRNCFWKIGNQYINEVAKWSTVPIFNMQCDIYHPCQSLADLMTIKEKFNNELRGKKFVISWAYAPSYTKPISVPQSLILLMTRFGMDVTLAHPPEFKLMPEIVNQAKLNAKSADCKFEIVHDMDAAFENAHVVYPKSWGCYLTTEIKEESMQISKKYTSWICDQRRMNLTDKKSLYMHCLPADRGYEVTDEVIDGPHSVIYDEAENRLHAQKGLMALTMSNPKDLQKIVSRM
ncbi:MAG: ornithine carbamoyltransferase [bacterium]